MSGEDMTEETKLEEMRRIGGIMWSSEERSGGVEEWWKSWKGEKLGRLRDGNKVEGYEKD